MFDTWQDKLDYLFSLDGATIQSSDIFRLFNKRSVMGPDGKVTVENPMFEPFQEINVKKGKLRNITEDMTTTVGRYIFNLCVIDYPFEGKWPYVNYTVRNDQYEELQDKLSDALLMNEITGEQFAEFQNKLVWMTNFAEIFVPGLSVNLLCLPQEIRNELQRLIDANRDIILANDIGGYLEKVEKPIIEFARRWYIANNEPGWVIFAKGGKPKFGNTFKNMFLEVGPILDIATGKFKISTSSFARGIPPEEQYLYANQNIVGAYKRAVATADSGAKTKELVFSMNSVVVDTEDCGSNLTIGIDVTKSNSKSIKWRYIRDLEDPKQFVLVTPNDVSKYIGKHVEFRSALLCKSDNLCYRCVGELYKRMGMKNVGLSTQKLTSTFLNASLKDMHDSTLDTRRVDWKNCLYKFV